MWKKHFSLWDWVIYLNATSHFSFQTCFKSYNLYITLSCKISKPSWRCPWCQANFFICYIQPVFYMVTLKKWTRYWEKICLIFFLLNVNYQYSLLLLYLNRDLLVIELIFRYKNILLRLPFCRRFSITLMFPR